MSLLRTLFPNRARNQAFLRRVAQEIGKEIEVWSIETLSRPVEEISFTRDIDGITVSFSIETFEKNSSGDLHVCVDVDGPLPIFPLASPSYVFWKKRDGAIYY